MTFNTRFNIGDRVFKRETIERYKELYPYEVYEIRIYNRPGMNETHYVLCSEASVTEKEENILTYEEAIELLAETMKTSLEKAYKEFG